MAVRHCGLRLHPVVVADGNHRNRDGTMRKRNVRTRTRQPRLRARSGAGLAVAMMFTIAMGALATSAIMLGSSSSLLTRSLNHERDLKYAADAALEWGKSRINAQPS